MCQPWEISNRMQCVSCLIIIPNFSTKTWYIHTVQEELKNSTVFYIRTNYFQSTFRAL